MRALKALVIIMGILIVVGVVVLVVTLLDRSGMAARRGAPYATEAAVGWGVIDMTASGDRLVVRHRAGSGERLTILDLATGRTVGTIELKAAP